MASRNSVHSAISSLLRSDYASASQGVLEEPDEGMRIAIDRGGLGFLSYKFDKPLICDKNQGRRCAWPLFPFYSHDKGVQRMCDYMLFCFHRSKLYILLIELKGREGVMQQLHAGLCFARFIVDTLNRVNKMNIAAEYRMISVRDYHIAPKGSVKPQDVHYREGFCTFEGNKFYLKAYLQ